MSATLLLESFLFLEGRFPRSLKLMRKVQSVRAFAVTSLRKALISVWLSQTAQSQFCFNLSCWKSRTIPDEPAHTNSVPRLEQLSLFLERLCRKGIKLWGVQIHTCLYSSIQRQPYQNWKLIPPDCTALGVSTVRTDQELHYVQMSLLAGDGQHPVQELLASVGTYKKIRHWLSWCHWPVMCQIHPVIVAVKRPDAPGSVTAPPPQAAHSNN